ncbi:MAG: helix-turn-helix domain-containing protein, partial [Clostridia bacterium]|nr:helix-turn-helix domain-containing protein [Clostridia bacterium]
SGGRRAYGRRLYVSNSDHNRGPVPGSNFMDEREREEKEALRRILQNPDVSFCEMLSGLIDAKHMSDVECYKKANVTRQTWHNILTGSRHRPQKNTVLRLAVALELTFSETQELLKTLGLTLSESIRADLIVSFYLKRKVYDIYRIDEELRLHGCPPLSSD